MQIKLLCLSTVFTVLATLPTSSLVHAELKAPIKIGQTVPTTGPASPNGNAIQQGTIAAFNRFNNKGGINGRKLELVSLDDAYDPEKTLKAYNKLIKDENVIGIITPYGGANIEAAEGIVDKEKVPVLSPVAPQNFSHPLRKYVFSNRLNSQEQCLLLAKYLVDDLGVKDIGLFIQDDALGFACRDSISKFMTSKKLEFSVVASYKRNATSVDEPAKQLLDKKPKAIVMAGIAPATILLVKKLSDQGYKPKYYGISAVTVPNFMRVAAQEKVDYTSIGLAPSSSDTSYELIRNYLEDMKAAGFTDTASPFAVEAYLNGLIFVEALRRAGANPDRESLRNAFENMNEADIYGLKISFSATNHHGLKDGFFVKLADGKLVPFKPGTVTIESSAK